MTSPEFPPINGNDPVLRKDPFSGMPTPKAVTRADVQTWFAAFFDLIESKSLAARFPKMYEREAIDLKVLKAEAAERLSESALSDPHSVWMRMKHKTVQAIRNIDHHSFLIDPDPRNEMQPRAPMKCAEKLLVELEGIRLGHISMPECPPISDLEDERYETAARAAVTRCEQESVQGYILDLRGNGGGNLWPMYAGLIALLGNGDVGCFYEPTPSAIDGSAKDIIENWTRSPYHEFIPTDFEILAIDKPVAVWIDNHTASSGEILVTMFSGRKDTKIFGVKSAGVPTTNKRLPLPDGSTLLLTTGTSGDRSGRPFFDRIVPDEELELGLDAQKDTQALYAATSKWLSTSLFL